jgi:choline kinase
MNSFKPTLVILAAGMASRYGSMKQVQGFGPCNETIMEYSIYDAIEVGFGKVIFIIREEFAQSFKNTFSPKLDGRIEVDYVYQDLNKFLNGRPLPATRVKPWGTGHAILCCKDVINEPFAVINADDFYGRDGMQKAYDFLVNECNENTYGIIGYKLINTLSENGSVSRGVCNADNDNNLIEINERTKVYKTVENVLVYEDEQGITPLPENTLVSMNLICFHQNVLQLCETEFDKFLEKNIHTEKGEFFIPLVTNIFIQNNLGNVKVRSTDAKWFGVTYKEDAPSVSVNLRNLIAEKVYPNCLWDWDIQTTPII